MTNGQIIDPSECAPACSGYGCGNCYEPLRCERYGCNGIVEDDSRYLNDATGLPYCSRDCMLLEFGDILLEGAPLCLVADHAVHVYAQYACACEVG